MNASVTIRQAGQSKKMAEARLSFEEHRTITVLVQFFSFLKMCIHFVAPCVGGCVHTHTHTHTYIDIYI
jgi:hypothetical protein